ncbi:LRR receptor-like serine/threonine-protein kinase FLS2 [Gossypium australe]|uniref:poly(A)-specific ribonuclease n=1 Tax=Gossypium australe TaxID=47621 RepID=A0A5B6VU11_9ROSI|nr:LRR receptor-like serine/threonine-protein kinase FLS2 [Gossypium australe]
MASRPDAMKIISWNVRGLGNPRAVRRLRFLLKEHNPDMVFFMETKVNDKRMEMIRRRSGFVNGIDVGAEGSRGGLCLAWREEIKVSLKTFSRNHIDVLIEENNIQGEWRFTGFYGSPYTSDQHASWSLLRALGQEQQFSWLVSGDFNEILYSFEKNGGQPREERKMAAFRRDGLKKELTKELGILLDGERNDNTMAKLIDTRIRLNMEIDKDKIYWEQRARANWLQLGNKTSAFFHKYASARRRINTINSLGFIGSFPCIDDQREALLEFKDLLFGELMTDNSTNMFLGCLETWNSSSECCQWALVECNSQQVTGLNLCSVFPTLGKTSTVLAPIFRIKTLMSLDISYNSIQGEIPGIGLRNLTELVFLDMRGNSFNGSIPLQLFHLANLEFLDLSDNMIEGLRKLEVLNLQNNSFSLEIPADVGSLVNLTTLDLSKNPLSGEIPSSIQKMSVKGQIPSWISNQTDLIYLDLSENDLEGDFSQWLAERNLGTIILSDNKLTGSLPSQLFQSRNLSVFELSKNNFSGEFPEINTTSIMVLLLSKNNFSGPLPKSISNIHRLLLLDLSKNSFSGNEFPAFGPDSLIAFVDVSSNNFSGKVPPHFGLFTVMLSLSQKGFYSPLPENFINLIMLEHLDLHDNNISGEFPAFFSQMSSLQVLNLKNNSIKGSISNDLSSLSSLKILDLSNNYLKGEIPQSLGNLTGMIETPDALLTLSEIFKFPVEIHDLILLNLSFNELSGKIPISFGDPENAETLDLSHNSLDGEIPGTFSKLLELNYLDLSNNKLGGKIPGGPQMDTLFDPKMYANNSGLCGVQIEVHCEEDLVPPGPPLRKKQEPMFSWIATGVGYPVGFLSSIAVMYVLGYFNTAPAYHRRGRLRSSLR